MESSVAIIGAGPGGLVAALVLAQRGVRPVVFEQASKLGEIGAGLSLPPNVSKILEGIGLRAYLESNAEQPSANQTRHFKTWELLVDIVRDNPRRDVGAPYYQIHRADLHAALVAAVENIAPNAIQTGKSLTGIEHSNGGASLFFMDGSKHTASVVIAADGLRSTVRNALFDPSAPHDLGYTAYRGLVANCDVAQAWQSDKSQNLVGPGAIFLSYHVRQGSLINFVGIAKSDAWLDEGWSTPASRSEILDRFSDWHPSVAEMVSATPPEALRKWGLFGHHPLEHFADKRVALIGDAAHPMLPFMGMGAAMAIEDATVIARCLTEISNPVEALKRYEQLRMERDHLVQIASQTAGNRLQGANPELIQKGTIRNEDQLGLFDYEALTMSLEV